MKKTVALFSITAASALTLASIANPSNAAQNESSHEQAGSSDDAPINEDRNKTSYGEESN
ncbi:hypothetical protein [Metabacillus sp. RGM 3146]|uniref:hypothetical protein n=1 Tax=Metabacillus sp. RGM 3146 TaxID=3401092 RepID=UPI003B9B874C